MKEDDVKKILEYIKGAIRYPLEKGQLASMVILHFDIPDKEAEELTELALIELARNQLDQPVCPEWNICKPDEHEFETIVTYETGEVAGYVAVEWCSKCGIIHENAYDEDGNFVAPYTSHVPTCQGTGKPPDEERPEICTACPTFTKGCEGSNQEDCEKPPEKRVEEIAQWLIGNAQSDPFFSKSISSTHCVWLAQQIIDLIDVEGTKTAERERIMAWGDETCVTVEHGWALALKKRGCSKCWQSLQSPEVKQPGDE